MEKTFTLLISLWMGIREFKWLHISKRGVDQTFRLFAALLVLFTTIGKFNGANFCHNDVIESGEHIGSGPSFEMPAVRWKKSAIWLQYLCAANFSSSFRTFETSCKQFHAKLFVASCHLKVSSCGPPTSPFTADTSTPTHPLTLKSTQNQSRYRSSPLQLSNPVFVVLKFFCRFVECIERIS